MSETRSYLENAQVCQMSTFLTQKGLNWYGHIRRREEDEDNLSRKMMDMVVPGKRRGRPRRRWTWLYRGREGGDLDGDGHGCTGEEKGET